MRGASRTATRGTGVTSLALHHPPTLRMDGKSSEAPPRTATEVRRLQRQLRRRTRVAHTLAIGGDGGVYGTITTSGLLRIFRALRLRASPDVHFVDIGSGIGRVLLAAHLAFPGIRTSGIEVDAHLFRLGRACLCMEGE